MISGVELRCECGHVQTVRLVDSTPVARAVKNFNRKLEPRDMKSGPKRLTPNEKRRLRKVLDAALGETATAEKNRQICEACGATYSLALCPSASDREASTGAKPPVASNALDSSPGAPTIKIVTYAKLTKRFLMSLETGRYLVSNCHVPVGDGGYEPSFRDVVAPPEQRAEQWIRIKAAYADGRNCVVLTSEQDYAAYREASPAPKSGQRLER